MDFAAALFGGENFAKVLGALMERPGVILTPSQITRMTGVSSKDSLYRALTRGRQIGLIQRHSVGAAGAYAINTESPIYPEVKVLIDKLAGFHKDLTEALQKLRGMEVSFIYGSAATGRARADSDVDVFVLGTVSTIAASRAVAKVASRYGRQVNVTAYVRPEVEERLRAGDPWMLDVLQGPKLFLIGSDDLLPEPVPTDARWSPA
jgi:predicted nucleotidyltransferase